MGNEELLQNRREISLKLCRQIRQNNFQMIKAKNFEERPYCDGENKRKFNTANYLRLLASERNYSDPRWYSEADIQGKNWTLKENATPELLESTQQTNITYRNFIMRQEVLNFLIVREILETDGEKIYHIDRIIRETGKDFGDGTHIIYVNGSYKGEE